MAQITHGVRAIFSLAPVYSMFQNLLGAGRLRRELVSRYIEPKSGEAILDIGCGPADILAFFPQGVNYWGMDLSEAYIEEASRRFGAENRRFSCQRFDENTALGGQRFDKILAVGLLHHLDDGAARHFYAVAGEALNPGGKIITIDPCFDPAQSGLARWIIARDRGQNVRDAAGYLALVGEGFSQVQHALRHDLLTVPYTHLVLQAIL